jgi:hypothetical protein
MNPLRLGYHSLQRAAFSPPQLRAGLAARRPARAAAFFHAARRRAQTSRPERYGTAKEPPPHLQEVTTSEGAEDGVKGAGPAEQTQQVPDAAGPPSSAEQKADGEPGAKADVIALPSPTPKEGAAATDPPAAPEGVLSVSKQEDSSSSNLPQLHPPPYMHHFDTWTLVRDLEKGGFTEEQAVTIMKAVRLLLTKNMDLARDALVSKSNVENVRMPTPNNTVLTLSRKCTSLELRRRNSRPRSRTRARPRRTRGGASARQYSPRSTF